MSGFIYIWKDKKYNKFYIGSHWGDPNNGYVCSSNNMRENHRNRPTDFKRRIISTIDTNRGDLLQEEQRWLNMIPHKEFGVKYYNINSKVNEYYWWMNEKTTKQVSKNISKATKKAMADPEIRQRYLDGLKIRKIGKSPEGKESQRQKMIAFWADPVNKKKTMATKMAGHKKPSEIKRKSESMKKRWQDPEYQQFQTNLFNSRPRDKLGRLLPINSL